MKTFKLIVSFFLITAFTYATVSKTEQNALLALYKSTNGNAWKTTWDLKAPINTWHGIKVENDKIVEINLFFNNLQGVLPKKLEILFT